MASKLDLGCFQDRGARKEQEDYFATSDTDAAVVNSRHGFLAVVADGMGGHSDGALASVTAVNRFVSEYSAKVADESVPDALQRSLLQANRALLSTIKKKGNGSDMGTTLVACVCQGGRLYWISVGDSRLFRLRQGVLEAINEDHSYGAELDAKYAAGQLSASRLEAESSKRHMLTSYLGINPIPKINLSRVALDLQAGDQILLCTDGLTNTLRDDEIASCLADDATAQERCEELGALVKDQHRPRQDNVTMVLVDVKAVDQAGAGAGFNLREHGFKLGAMIFAAVLAAALAAGAVLWLSGSPGKAPAPAPQTPPPAKSPKAQDQADGKPAPQATQQPQDKDASETAKPAAVQPGDAQPKDQANAAPTETAKPVPAAASAPAAAAGEAAPSGAKAESKPRAELTPSARTDKPMDLKTAQMILKKMNLYKGPIDGLMGRGTRTAIKTFQKRQGIKPVNGVLNPRTADALHMAAQKLQSSLGGNSGSPRAAAPNSATASAPSKTSTRAAQAKAAPVKSKPVASALVTTPQQQTAKPATGAATPVTTPAIGAGLGGQSSTLTGGGPAPAPQQLPSQTGEPATPAKSEPRKAALQNKPESQGSQEPRPVFSDGTE